MEATVVLYSVVFVVGLALSVLFLRLTFSVQQFLNIQKKQVKLLSEIAKASNVSPDVIDGIHKSDCQ